VNYDAEMVSSARDADASDRFFRRGHRRARGALHASVRSQASLLLPAVVLVHPRAGGGESTRAPIGSSFFRWSSPVRLFWMWNEAMASDGGSSSFRELYGNIHTPAVLTGAAFALVALLLSLCLILQHLRSYSDPAEQKWIIAVLFMVPVYASESFSILFR